MSTPVVYEVNIDVDPTIADAYLAWLQHHIVQMHTQIEGITSVSLCKRPKGVDGAGANWVGFTAYYHISTRAALDDYLEHRAAAMRQDGLNTFGEGKFVGARRILDIIPETPQSAE
ncbi:Hypothetical protein, putative [Bodo saltans]|uniref:DUF4286 family protein n=1 Tax=Bodo saltans TaxID=75058 RepID=A0A0S4IQR2_BODSA|nr:Hypothetical protein, putative [Bodo saltans]|eukprot:CUE72052.1 Hypothetical protein, putative [Bodo saltans]